MAKHILHCVVCSRYTMKPLCVCGGKAIEHKPAKYSPEDKYGQYRRAVKQEERKREGFL